MVTEFADGEDGGEMASGDRAAVVDWSRSDEPEWAGESEAAGCGMLPSSESRGMPSGRAADWADICGAALGDAPGLLFPGAEES